jgi:hypothetical protein
MKTFSSTLYRISKTANPSNLRHEYDNMAKTLIAELLAGLI